MYSAAVITISTKGARGEREDTSGPNLVRMLKEDGYDVKYTNIVSDDKMQIVNELNKTISMKINLVLTTGGTGFTKTDITPEATKEVIEREAPGISEAMRMKCFELTEKSCLSRGISGIKDDTLIVNLPGSKKAAEENYSFVRKALIHGMQMLLSEGSNECGK